MAEPSNALAQGMQLLKGGQFADAEQVFLGILARDKESIHARLGLGITCYQLGRLTDAEKYLTETISRSPDALAAYNNLGLVYKAQGDPQRGMATLRRALEIQPGYVDAIYNLAVMQEEGGDRNSAMDSYRQVIALKADFLRAHTNLGLLLRAAGDFATAHDHLHSVATQSPQDVSALVNLVLVLTDLARYAEAINIGVRATQQAPDEAKVWEALGNAQRLASDAGSAVTSLQRAHALHPSSVELQYELGLAQSSAGDLAAAHTTFNAVARLKPDWLKIWFARDLALPPLYLNDAHIADSRARFTTGIENIEARLFGDAQWSVADAVDAISGYAPFYLHYQGLDNTALQRRFGRIVEVVARRAWPQFAEPVPWRPCAHGGRLRVGFVSAYLRRHSVGNFFGNWICQLDAQKFESFVWYTGEAGDDVTEKIRLRAAHYSHAAFDAPTLAKTIRASQLDVLIYPDVGMHPQSQVLAALHLAPVQCATFGHPATTGIDSIHFFLSADAAEPAIARQHYTEKLIRLPRFAVSYPRPDVSNQRTPPLLKTLQQSLLLCAQPLFKILPHFDQLAARIARELPGCKLAFFQSMWPRINDSFVTRVSAALRAAGVDPATTLMMLPIMPYEEYLGALAAADVLLDTPGFSGGNSSFDAIAVGTPIITYRGEMLRGRQTAAMLDIVGARELVSATDDDYVRNAVTVATNKVRQRELREHMRAGSGALFDDVGAVRALETALQQLLM